MKIDLNNEVLSVENGTYTGIIDTIQSYGDDDRILMKIMLTDGITLVKFYKSEDLGSYPWSNIFRALNTDDTDDLISKTVEIEVVNSVSKTTGSEFCNIKKVKLK